VPSIKQSLIKQCSPACGAVAIALCCLASASPSVSAANRGLIMTISEYPAPAALPGVKLDLIKAKRMAEWMQVPDANLTVVEDDQLKIEGMRESLRKFAGKIEPGDQVFIYYSGHGGRSEVMAGDNPGCAESFVSQDLGLYMGREFRAALSAISDKARSVAVFADACHAGGVGDDKSRRVFSDEQLVAKVHPGFSFAGTGRCEPVNLQLRTRGAAGNVVFVAAARDNEVAWASQRGSVATRAWEACMERLGTEPDSGGAISFRELGQCAQRWIDERNINQHLHIVGNAETKLAFAATGARPANAASEPRQISPSDVLNSLLKNADPKRVVQMTLKRKRVRIGHDSVELQIATREAGYLYLLQAGSDKKSLGLLFPNPLDENNFISAGTHRFPRAAWEIRANGPAGEGKMLGMVSRVKYSLHELESLKSGRWADCGAGDCIKAYGADIATIEEVN
jgi:hypothetical protein